MYTHTFQQQHAKGFNALDNDHSLSSLLAGVGGGR